MPNLCANQIRELGTSKEKSKKTILALTPDRFVYDLNILAASDHFSVSRMPLYWQYAVMDLVEGKQYHLENPKRCQLIVNFLLALKRVHNIDCVISACLWYRQDIPWAEASTKAGIPFILLHKESLKTEKRQLEQTKIRSKQYGPFKGTHVVVHNERFRDALIDSKYVNTSQITSLGAMRMDSLARKLTTKQNQSSQKRAVLFSFPHRADGVLSDEEMTGQSGPFPDNPYLGWVRLFESTHSAFARAALAMPDAEFIIKLKWKEGWAERVELALASNGLVLSKIPNLTIDISTNSHDLILDSRVVCGFNSTTVLESGIFNKTVIIPRFDEAVRPGYVDVVKYPEAYHLFDVAESPEAFTDLIVERLQFQNPIDDDILRERRECFEKLISPLDGRVSERYIELIDRLT